MIKLTCDIYDMPIHLNWREIESYQTTIHKSATVIVKTKHGACYPVKDTHALVRKKIQEAKEKERDDKMDMLAHKIRILEEKVVL